MHGQVKLNRIMGPWAKQCTGTHTRQLITGFLFQFQIAYLGGGGGGGGEG